MYTEKRTGTVEQHQLHMYNKSGKARTEEFDSVYSPAVEGRNGIQGNLFSQHPRGLRDACRAHRDVAYALLLYRFHNSCNKFSESGQDMPCHENRRRRYQSHVPEKKDSARIGSMTEECGAKETHDMPQLPHSVHEQP
jgi:hypothetical protein